MTASSNPTLQFLGAAGTVTGSRYLVEANGQRVLVDCGLFQGYKQLRERNWAPFPVEASSIDAVVLTHAHLDHSGYLPALVKQGFRGRIHCTHGSVALCGLLLPDSGHLLEEEAKYAARKGYSKHKEPRPLYTEDDARRSLKQLKGMTMVATSRSHQASRSASILPATSWALPMSALTSRASACTSVATWDGSRSR